MTTEDKRSKAANFELYVNVDVALGCQSLVVLHFPLALHFMEIRILHFGN